MVYVLAKDEGGRHTPIFGGYKPQFFFRTTNVTGEVGLSEGVEMVMPGDNATVWAINVLRGRTRGPKWERFSQWVPTYANFDSPTHFGELTFK